MLDDIQVLGRDSALATQNKVLRNTYMMLGLTMIPTVIGAYLGIQMNFSWMAQHPFMFFIGFMAVSMGMQSLIVANRNNSMGVVLLFVFTFLLGIFLGSLLQHALRMSNGAQLVSLSAAGTGIIFVTMAAIAATTKRDLSNMAKFLAVGMVLAIIGIVANIFLQIPAFSLAISGVIILISSAYILYTINGIVKGGETNYLMATMALFISLFNIFSNLLSILMSLAGNRD